MDFHFFSRDFCHLWWTSSFCSVGPDHTNSRDNISKVFILANTTLKATLCMAMAKSNISKIIGSQLTSSYLNESRLYLVKLLEYQSDSNLTFNLTFQFNKCKNIVGNSAPNMLTSVTFTICKCSNFWSDMTCTNLFREGNVFGKVFRNKW